VKSPELITSSVRPAVSHHLDGMISPAKAGDEAKSRARKVQQLVILPLLGSA
jgi:hypothetical protein